ncbi:MAG: penicillin-binding protein activator [candidate division Zixibacteria bacterium]|nr:penicillin-binding protein activator [candidate division Zixibacteria bacterium]
MRRLATVFSAAFFLALLPALQVLGETLDDKDEVVALYTKAKRLCHEERWSEATQIFSQLLTKYPKSKNTDLFMFNRGKALYHGGNLTDAATGFQDFISRFKNSATVGHAYFFLANCDFQSGRRESALDNYLKAFASSQDTSLSRLALASLHTGWDDGAGFAVSEIADLPRSAQCALWSELGEIMTASRDEAPLIKRLTSECGQSDNVSLRTDTPSENESVLDIAVVLPFSGELQSFAEEIYSGAVVAAELAQAESDITIKLTQYDSKGDPIDAGRVIKVLIPSATDAIVGPLTTAECAVAAALLANDTLPLIAPAASGGGLTSLSGSIFQLSTSLDVQAMLTADHAYSNFNARTAVILTSTESEYQKMAAAFKARFEELGGKVLAEQYYHLRDKDFGPHIRSVKDALRGGSAESAHFINERGDTLEADGVPADVDCIYLPGNPTQLRLLLSQISFYNLRGKYLGSDAWGDESILALGDDVTQNAIFPSTLIPALQSDAYRKFATQYDARYGKKPERLAALGYDAVAMLAHLWHNGSTTRGTLTFQLAKMQDYTGASGRLTLNKYRENSNVPFYQVREKKAIPVVSQSKNGEQE